MPRDVNGNYTLPAGNPVVTLTPIATTWANPTLSDLASAITDSLDRYGRGGMLAPFQFANGAVGAPSMTFTSEPTTGFYRIGAAQIGVAIAGVLKLTMNAGGFIFANPITVNGTSFDPADYLSKAGNLSGLANAATARSNLGLGNVENTALSTWAGSTNITTLGTITTGTVPVARVSGLGTMATQNAASVAITGGSIGPFTISGAITGADYNLTRVNLLDYSEQKQVVAAAATTSIDFTSGSVVELTQDTNITTLNLNNPPPSGTAGALTIIRVKDNTGTSRTITWPASVKWMNAAAPTLTQTANAVDIINLITYNAGTTWRGTYATNFA